MSRDERDTGDWPVVLLDVQIWKRISVRVRQRQRHRRTGVADARAVHLDKTFTGLELVGLLDGVVLADFDRGSRSGDDGGNLNLWDGHRRSWIEK